MTEAPLLEYIGLAFAIVLAFFIAQSPTKPSTRRATAFGFVFAVSLLVADQAVWGFTGKGIPQQLTCVLSPDLKYCNAPDAVVGPQGKPGPQGPRGPQGLNGASIAPRPQPTRALASNPNPAPPQAPTAHRPALKRLTTAYRNDPPGLAYVAPQAEAEAEDSDAIDPSIPVSTRKRADDVIAEQEAIYGPAPFGGYKRDSLRQYRPVQRY
jgi:hypothetical protein